VRSWIRSTVKAMRNRERVQVEGTRARRAGGSVSELRETRHPRNVKFNEVFETCFSGAGNSRFSEVWNLQSLKFAKV
jgi:hypothetical protein